MIYVSNYSELKKLILREFHVKLYSGNPRYQKTLTTVNKFYYWPNLNKEVTKFMARCLHYQQGCKIHFQVLEGDIVGLGIELAFSIAYHPKTDGQTERVNRILEDMLRMYVMHQQRKWEEFLPLVELTYNNGYQESLRMSPFKVFYGRSCNTPINWSDLVNMVLIGPDMLKDMEQETQVIKKNLKATQDRQKSYSDQHWVFKQFQVGEHVYLRIMPKKISLRIGSCAKLAPQYCRPFEILERIGTVAYRLALPPTVKFHDFFHISLLKKYINDVDHVIDWLVLQVEQEGEFQPEPQCILQRKHHMLRNRDIEQVKVQWKHFGLEEATWEMVDQMQTQYPSLFSDRGKIVLV
eukprot:PITA_12799